MTHYEIWIGGWRATGGYGLSHKVGMADGETFKDACINFYKGHPEGNFFDSDNMTYWGCGLYDNEDEAKKMDEDIKQSIRSKDGYLMF